MAVGGRKPLILPDDFYCRDATERRLLDQCADLATRFAERAPRHDREGSFPHENIADLCAAGYPALTVPAAYGGQGGGVFAGVLCQERLARGDGSTALAIGWHLLAMGRQALSPTWPVAARERLFRDAVDHGALVNAALSEPATGSPTRGGRPTTQARRTPGGWTISGRKTFTTLAPAIATFVVSATAEGVEGVAALLVPADAPGLRIDETWDALGMRATGSHDLVLQDVAVAADALVEPNPHAGAAAAGSAPVEVQGGSVAGWGLLIPAVYLGVARAAADFAVDYAARRRPNSLSGGSIADVPHVQEKLGLIARHLLPAYNLLFTLARRWDDDADARPALVPAVGVCKVAVMDAVLTVVDLAMRVVGAAGLSRSLPLERYYRDVRAGLHNPPMEDAVLTSLARQLAAGKD